MQSKSLFDQAPPYNELIQFSPFQQFLKILKLYHLQELSHQESRFLHVLFRFV